MIEFLSFLGAESTNVFFADKALDWFTMAHVLSCGLMGHTAQHGTPSNSLNSYRPEANLQGEKWTNNTPLFLSPCSDMAYGPLIGGIPVSVMVEWIKM